jgi:Domain of unknown function (DUF389)
MATNSSPYLRLILLPPNSKTNDALFVHFGRGNARSLWMGVLWALTSGSGVAVALLQGSAGPLIGVAISASLLPPVVNCVSYRAEARLQDEFELILHSGSAHFSFSLSLARHAAETTSSLGIVLVCWRRIFRIGMFAFPFSPLSAIHFEHLP